MSTQKHSQSKQKENIQEAIAELTSILDDNDSEMFLVVRNAKKGETSAIVCGSNKIAIDALDTIEKNYPMAAMLLHFHKALHIDSEEGDEG